jgi:hypothetical protein
VTSRVSCEDLEKLEEARRFLYSISRIYVAGYVHLGMPEAYRFDLEYTRRALEPLVAFNPEKVLSLLPCPRGSRDAAGLLEAYSLLLMDRRVDVTGVALDLVVRSTTLVAVPFEMQGKGLRDPLTGHVLSQRFLIGAGTGGGTA